MVDSFSHSQQDRLSTKAVLCYTEPMKPSQLTLKPDLILIKADDAKQRTKSVLYLNEEWKTLPPLGTVEAVGDDITDVKVGDRVIFERYGAIRVSLDTEPTKKDENYRLCKIEHVLARIDVA